MCNEWFVSALLPVPVRDRNAFISARIADDLRRFILDGLQTAQHIYIHSSDCNEVSTPFFIRFKTHNILFKTSNIHFKTLNINFNLSKIRINLSELRF